MARLSLKYHPAARFEADQAFDWYRGRSANAAIRFQQRLEEAQADIQDAPVSWAKYLHGTRRYKLK